MDVVSIAGLLKGDRIERVKLISEIASPRPVAIQARKTLCHLGSTVNGRVECSGIPGKPTVHGAVARDTLIGTVSGPHVEAARVDDKHRAGGRWEWNREVR